MRISDWSSDVCSSDLREPLNACAVHDERAGPADHAAEVGGTCARGHGQGRTIQRDIAPWRAAPVQVRKAVVEAVKGQQYARDIAEGHGAGADGAGRTGAQATSLDYRSARDVVGARLEQKNGTKHSQRTAAADLPLTPQHHAIAHIEEAIAGLSPTTN